MADLWLPDVARITGNSSGSMNGDGSRKILLHSTEGSSIQGAVSAYRDHNSWPTLTVDCPERRVVEHLPLNVGARALQNDPGGADQTNRDGSICVQIELVGFAERPASIGVADDLDWLGREVIGPIARLCGVPLVSPVTWAPYPASYGERAGQRLSPAEWDAYSGVLGHQHAPDNDHGDPGAIDIDRILAAARGDQEDDMPFTKDDLVEAARKGTVLALRKEGTTQSARQAVLELATRGATTALNKELSTAYTTARTELRELAKMGADDTQIEEKLDELIAAFAASEPDAPADIDEA